jgi:hypothetical protein
MVPPKVAIEVKKLALMYRVPVREAGACLTISVDEIVWKRLTNIAQ